MESTLWCLPEELAEPARTEIIGTIAKARRPPVNMLPQEHQGIKSLQKDDKIVVLERHSMDNNLPSTTDSKS